MGMIFISYRRDDTADTCGRIYDRLVMAFGKAAIFMDVDAIPVGVRFPQYIAETIQRTSVQLVVIGPHWLDATTDDGERRLDIPSDFVRQEIEAALRRGIPVIPILVQGATMPPAGGLPPSLRDLASHNAIPVRRNPDFDNDMRRLIDALTRWVAPAPPPYGQRVAGGAAPQAYPLAHPGPSPAARPPAIGSMPRPSAIGPVLRWGLACGTGYVALALMLGIASPRGIEGNTALSFAFAGSAVALLLAGMFASRRAGTVWAGILAAESAGILSAVLLPLVYLISHGSSVLVSGFIPALLLVIVVVIIYTAILGGIGALIGRAISPYRKKA